MVIEPSHNPSGLRFEIFGMCWPLTQTHRLRSAITGFNHMMVRDDEAGSDQPAGTKHQFLPTAHAVKDAWDAQTSYTPSSAPCLFYKGEGQPGITLMPKDKSFQLA